MLTKKMILHLFHRLNEELEKEGEVGEIGIVGGTVMCIVYNARDATKDIDGVFEPTQILRKAAKKIADSVPCPAMSAGPIGSESHFDPNTGSPVCQSAVRRRMGRKLRWRCICRQREYGPGNRRWR